MLKTGFQRLDAGGCEISGGGDAQTSEASGIDKAKLAARGELCYRGRGLDDLRLRIADLQTAAHAEMDDKLGCGFGSGCFRGRVRSPTFSGRRRPLYIFTIQVEDDVFADAADGENARVFHRRGDFWGGGFRGLGL